MSSKLILISVVAFSVISLLAFYDTDSSVTDCTVTQVRMQLGDNYSPSSDRVWQNDVTISFHTPSECPSIMIEILQNDLVQFHQYSENVHSLQLNQQFCHNGKLCENVNYDQYIHHFYVKLQNQGSFIYNVISQGSVLAGPFDASVPTKESNGVQKFLYLGDLDNLGIAQNTWNLMHKIQNDEATKTDATIWLGDFGYEFYQSNGKQGDLFLETLSPLSSRVPWMMTPGNHEDNLNFTFYNDKFRSPNYERSNNHYYSFDVGLVHFISLDLHFYDDGDKNTAKTDKSIQKQFFNWVENDLKEANKNRKTVPWIIAFGHKSVYCVSSECSDFSTQFAVFDDLFYQYGLDVFIGAHKHQYQFLRPVHHDKIKDFDHHDSYTVIEDPEATIYVIQGNGGNKNMMEDLQGTHTEYLLESDGEPGLGYLTVYNSTVIKFECMEAAKQSVKDFKYVVKKSHKSFSSSLEFQS